MNYICNLLAAALWTGSLTSCSSALLKAPAVATSSFLKASPELKQAMHVKTTEPVTRPLVEFGQRLRVEVGFAQVAVQAVGHVFGLRLGRQQHLGQGVEFGLHMAQRLQALDGADRKSTRLNSSHT